jgi:hypothetical protein
VGGGRVVQYCLSNAGHTRVYICTDLHACEVKMNVEIFMVMYWSDNYRRHTNLDYITLNKSCYYLTENTPHHLWQKSVS